MVTGIDELLVQLAEHLEPDLRTRLLRLVDADAKAPLVLEFQQRAQRAEDLATECRRQLTSLLRRVDGPVPRMVDQTILATDPKRLGNCFAACVATYLGVELETVPNFVEFERDTEHSTAWWHAAIGYMAAYGLWAFELANLQEAERGEVVFAAGPSPRGVHHQVLYLEGQLFHDPHPSRAGLIAVTEVIAWRPRRHDHDPTPS